MLINNLKTASARRTRNRFAQHLAPFYSKPLLIVGNEVSGTTAIFQLNMTY